MTSRAPGQGLLDASLIGSAALCEATDEQLAHTVAAIQAEQHQRALDTNDIDALVEQAFLDGFTSRGEAAHPWLHGGLLICPGYIRYKSATSHDCQFVSVDGEWVWTTNQILFDGMRDVPGPKTLKHAVTIVHADEGMTFDVVSSTAKSGASCQMKNATSYQVRSGTLVAVNTRARAPKGHSIG